MFITNIFQKYRPPHQAAAPTDAGCCTAAARDHQWLAAILAGCRQDSAPSTDKSLGTERLRRFALRQLVDLQPRKKYCVNNLNFMSWQIQFTLIFPDKLSFDDISYLLIFVVPKPNN